MTMPVSLEESLKRIIKRRIRETPEYQKHAAEGSLGKITRGDLEDFQLFQLRKMLHYVFDKSPFYRELFIKRGIEPGEIQSLADLAKLPLTEPEELAEKPFRFLCVPIGKVARVITFTSSGTTGPQKRVFFTQKDLEIMTTLNPVEKLKNYRSNSEKNFLEIFPENGKVDVVKIFFDKNFLYDSIFFIKGKDTIMSTFYRYDDNMFPIEITTFDRLKMVVENIKNYRIKSIDFFE